MVSVLAFWRWMVARRRHWPWRSLDISGEVHEFAEIRLNKLAEIQLNKHAEIQLKKLAEIQLNNHNCELDCWYKTKHSTNESISRFNEILNFDISAIEHLTSFFGITSNSILLKNTLFEVWNWLEWSATLPDVLKFSLLVRPCSKLTLLTLNVI